MLGIVINWHIRKNADLFIDLFLDEDSKKLLFASLSSYFGKTN